MKRLLIILATLMLAVGPALCQVNFRSAEFEFGIRQHLGLGSNGSVTNEMLDTITVADLSGLGITTIQDVELLPMLQRVDLSYNDILDVSPLVLLDSLREVDLSHNQLESLNMLTFSQNKEMSIDVSFNYITDFSCFNTLTPCIFSIAGAGLQKRKDAPYFDVDFLYADATNNTSVYCRIHSNTGIPAKLVCQGSEREVSASDNVLTWGLDNSITSPCPVILTSGTVVDSTWVVPVMTKGDLKANESVTIETGLPEDFTIRGLASPQQGTIQIDGTVLTYSASGSFEYDEFVYAYYKGATLKGYSKIVFGDVPSAYAWLSSDGKTLTFCYDNKREERVGHTYDLNNSDNLPEWNPAPSYSNPSSVTKVVFNSSFSDARPTSTFSWFCYFEDLTEIEGLEYLNTSEVTNMSNMFAGCSSLENIDVSHFHTSKVENMYAMFWRCCTVRSLNVSSFDTSNVTDMGFMFCLCGSLKSLDVSNFNTSKVTDMENMFSSIGVETLNLSNFDTRNVTNMYFMFADNYYLKNIDVSNFNTSNVENFYCMFYRCTSLKSLDVSNFDISPSSSWYFYVAELFSNCTSLQRLCVSSSMSGLDSSACTNVGTEEHPCTLVAPDNFDFGVDVSGSTFEWKQGFFKSGVYLPGDFNINEMWDQQDIDYLANAILENQQPTKATDLNNDGKLNVADVTILIKAIQDGCWPVHEYVDLGLPSGTLWATCNVGASSPEEYGDYFAWGETEAKDTYNWSTYIHCDGSSSTCHDIGSDIAGTEYDAATANWGAPWRMPSLAQIKELLNNTTSEWTTLNGVYGRKFTGSNGGTIFLPAAGYRYYGELYLAGYWGYYWSSTLGESYPYDAYYLDLYSGDADWLSLDRSGGQSVRPVR